MVNFEKLERDKEKLRMEYQLAKPFPYLAIDNFCKEGELIKAYESIPVLENKSRDYVFANNKFEKSNYKALSEEFNTLHQELNSERMNSFLSFVTNEEVFVDPKNFGGGLHQGKENSFLDMHLDFNYHPLEKNWYRSLNLLLYLNKDWEPNYGGQLKIKDLRSGKTDELAVPFNRMIIQKTCGYTLHGYDQTNFPEGVYRTSIATYAYTIHQHLVEKPRTTDWFPKEDSSVSKKFMAKHYNTAVKLKNKLFGSATAKNQ